jgi:hypothetical protein
MNRMTRTARAALTAAAARSSARFNAFERLESRQHLSTAVVNGELTVTTGDGPDNVVIQPSQSGTRYFSSIVVFENGAMFTFHASGVSRIRVATGAGNDNVALLTAAPWGTLPPATVIGGAGNDTIQGGADFDVIAARRPGRRAERRQRHGHVPRRQRRPAFRAGNRIVSREASEPSLNGASLREIGLRVFVVGLCSTGGPRARARFPLDH